MILSAVPISFFGLAALLAGKKLGGNNCFKSILQLFQLAAVLVVHKSSGDPDTGQQVVFVYLLIFVDLLNFRHHLLRVLNHDGFGDFELEVGGGQAAVGQGTIDLGQKVGLGKL